MKTHLPVNYGRVRMETPEGCAPSALCPLPSAFAFGGGGGGSSSSSTSTQNVDKSLTTESGEILALQDSTVNVSEGGVLTIISKDPGAAVAAINAIESQSDNVLRVVTALGHQANESAQLVTKSQEQFVEAASGQRSATNGLLIIGGIVAAIYLFKK